MIVKSRKLTLSLIFILVLHLSSVELSNGFNWKNINDYTEALKEGWKISKEKAETGW
jgi:hypothetical protein